MIIVMGHRYEADSLVARSIGGRAERLETERPGAGVKMEWGQLGWHGQ